MEETNKYVGRRIREAREERGITQKELGDFLGYSPMGVSHFEKGIRELKFSDIKKLADFFHRDVLFFLPQQATYFRAESANDPVTAKSLKDFDAFITTLDE